MAQDENDLVKEFRKEFQEHWPLGIWRKLHGDRFQSGLPDILAAHAGLAALIEFKWVKSASLIAAPLRKVIGEKLTAQQMEVLAKLSALSGPLKGRVVLGCPIEADELPGGTAVLAVGGDYYAMTQITDVSMEDLASIALTGFITGLWPPLVAPVKFQLRTRGQKWRASEIALGLAYKHESEDDSE